MEVTFLPMNRKAVAKTGDNILGIARSLGIDLDAICSGYGSCKKCKVIISKGNNKQLTQLEEETFTKEEVASGLRLACQYVVTSDICVIVPGSNQTKKSLGIKKNVPYRANKRLGVAFDLGTTSVAASLWDLDEKRKLGYVTGNNKQRVFGADVISRITYSLESQNNLHRLQGLILKTCNELIHELLEQVQLDEGSILSIVAVGNTTMSHLFVGERVEAFSKSGIPPTFMEGDSRNANQMGLLSNSLAQIDILPNIGGHVGSDTLACILATKIYDTDETCLIIDVGTNGEMVLASKGRMLACSTAAGPAFEGATISQGMRAIPGAISEVIIEGEDIRLKVIGNVEPIGICGSGIIDAIAGMKNNGYIDHTGRILKSNGKDHDLENWNPNFLLARMEGEKVVSIIQKDIREVQLAKAAIHAGVTVLLKQMELSLDEVDHVYLAGAFGSHINIQNAITIGLLPCIDVKKVKYIGNGALQGAEQVLNNIVTLTEVKAIRNKVEHLELAQEDTFKEEYIKSINF